MKITMQDIEDNILTEHYFTVSKDKKANLNVLSLRKTETGYEEILDGTVPESLELLTICVLVLKNGFTVVGEAACADPAIFNAEEGRKWAREYAIERTWILMGYALKEQLYQISK